MVYTPLAVLSADKRVSFYPNVKKQEEQLTDLQHQSPPYRQAL
jgi:hypothetical protein